DVDTHVTESRPRVRNLLDPQTKCRLVSCRLLGVPTAMGELRKRDSFAHTHRVALSNPLGQRATARWPQSFFRTTSPKMCLSSVSSATNRFNRAFSSRSCRSSRISVRPSFPYFFFHR